MRVFIQRIIDVYKPFKRPVLASISLLLVASIFSIIAPYIHGMIIDEVIAKNNIRYLMYLVLASFMLYLGSQVISQIRSHIDINFVSYDSYMKLSVDTFKSICGFSLGQHLNQNSGIRQSVMDKGESALLQISDIFFYQIIPISISITIITVVLTFMNPLLGFIIITGIVIYIWVAVRMNRKFKEDVKHEEDMWHEMNKSRTEFLKNISLIKTNAQEDKASGEFTKKTNDLQDFAKALWSKFVIFAGFRDLTLGITRYIILSVAVWQVFYTNEYAPGFLVVILAWSNRALGDVHSLGYLHRKLTRLNASVDKYYIMKGVASDIAIAADPIYADKLNGDIEFENVYFSYPVRRYVEDENDEVLPKQPVPTLIDVSIDIRAGQKVAFVGRSGSGKTTASHLILRAFDPDQGRITIDGKDLRLYHPATYLDRVGTVEQNIELIDETIRYNMLFGLNGRAKDTTEAQLLEAVELSRMSPFFKDLEDGLDTVIGEKGIKISGGERQRLGIARALMKKPDIFLFDEATSSLDTENESIIHESLNRASEGKTTIIIAHRLSTILDADKIYVFDKGKVVSWGTHQELEKNCPTYEALIKNQISTF